MPAKAHGDDQKENTTAPATPADHRPTVRPLASSMAVERSFRVDGKKVTARATIPATVAQVLGMETVLEMAGKIIIDIESKQAKITPLKLGEN